MSRSRTPTPPPQVPADVAVDEWLNLDVDAQGNAVEMQAMPSQQGSSSSSSSTEESDLSSILSLAESTKAPVVASPAASSPAVDSSTPLLSVPSSNVTVENDPDADADDYDYDEDEVSDNETSRVNFRENDENEEKYSNTVVGATASALSNVFSRFGLSSQPTSGTSTAIPSGIAKTLAAHSSITNQAKPNLDNFVVWKGQYEFTQYVHVMCANKKEGIQLGRDILANLPSLKRAPWVYHAGEKNRQGNIMGEQYPQNKDVSFFRIHVSAYESLRRLQPGLNLPAFGELLAYKQNSGDDVFTQKYKKAVSFANN